MQSPSCEKNSRNNEIDLLLNPPVTPKWMPQVLCGQNRWKVYSGIWDGTSDRIVYRKDPEVMTGENIAVTGSAQWSNYGLRAVFRILTASIRPPEGGVILYYHFENMNNHYALHFCHVKNTLELIKRVRGAWSTVAAQDFSIETQKDYEVVIDTGGGCHSFLINGAEVLKTVDRDIMQGRIGIGMKYCDVEFSRASVLLHEKTG